MPLVAYHKQINSSNINTFVNISQKRSRIISAKQLTISGERWGWTFAQNRSHQNWNRYLRCPAVGEGRTCLVSLSKYWLQGLLGPIKWAIFTPSPNLSAISGKMWLNAADTIYSGSLTVWRPASKSNVRVRTCCRQKEGGGWCLWWPSLRNTYSEDPDLLLKYLIIQFVTHWAYSLIIEHIMQNYFWVNL